jgi:hypothetical protein
VHNWIPGKEYFRLLAAIGFFIKELADEKLTILNLFPSNYVFKNIVN